jgi:N6-L-threonylcarbamoyladenine synthase
MERPLVLGIETSCDDTACALVDGAGRVLASAVSSQIRAHAPYGGVVPEIASREHLTNWPWVVAEALRRAGLGGEPGSGAPDPAAGLAAEPDAVAATRGPGLVGSLLVGLSLGKALAWARARPFFAVHHLEGHLYSPFLRAAGEPAAEVPERFVGLVVSGGHTCLYQVEAAAGGDAPRVETVAETRDDAFGEAFDKFGKRLGLAYPQGPEVDALAELGDASRARLPSLAGTDELFFSYSGLKTQALTALEALGRRGVPTRADPERDPKLAPEVLDLVAGFRDSAVRQVVDRLTRLHRRRPFDRLAVSGGAAANRELRRRLPGWAAERGVGLDLVPLVYSGDNAAMIAFAALLRLRRGESGDDPRRAEAASRLPLGA